MAKGNKRKFGSFRYPIARLENDSDYLEIKVVEYQPPGLEAGGGGQIFDYKQVQNHLRRTKKIY